MITEAIRYPEASLNEAEVDRVAGIFGDALRDVSQAAPGVPSA
jgi:hypothetical protein